MTQVPTVQGFLESNRTILTSPFQLDATIRSQQGELEQDRARLRQYQEEQRTYPERYAQWLRGKASWENMTARTAERKAQKAAMLAELARPENQIQDRTVQIRELGPEIDFHAQLISNLQSVATNLEAARASQAITTQNAGEVARAEFQTLAQNSGIGELGNFAEGQSFAQITANAARESDNWKKALEANPTDQNARARYEYWESLEAQATVAGVGVGERDKARDQMVQEANTFGQPAGVVVENITKDLQADKSLNTYLIIGGVALGALALIFFLKSR